LKEIINRVKDAGLMDDIRNGFPATSGHDGTHTLKYVNQLIKTMKGKIEKDDLLQGIAELREMIEKGVFRPKTVIEGST